jgi:lysyl-tRNA synthetase class II
MEKIKVDGTFELMEYLYKNDCIYLFGEIVYNKEGREFLVVSKLDAFDYCFDELDYMVENYGVDLKYGKRYFDGVCWVCKVKNSLYYVSRY